MPGSRRHDGRIRLDQLASSGWHRARSVGRVEAYRVRARRGPMGVIRHLPTRYKLIIRGPSFSEVAVQTCVRGLAAQCARAVARTSRPGGRGGTPGAQCAGSLACEVVVKICTRVFTAVAPESPGIPARSGFTFIRALPGEPCSF